MERNSTVCSWCNYFLSYNKIFLFVGIVKTQLKKPGKFSWNLKFVAKYDPVFDNHLSVTEISKNDWYRTFLPRYNMIWAFGEKDWQLILEGVNMQNIFCLTVLLTCLILINFAARYINVDSSEIQWKEAFELLSKIWKNAVQFTNSILNVHQENGLDVMMCRDQKDYASIIY